MVPPAKLDHGNFLRKKHLAIPKDRLILLRERKGCKENKGDVEMTVK
jgi:hypothetical protein